MALQSLPSTRRDAAFHILGLVAIFALTFPARADVPPITRAIDGFIRPAYDSFRESTVALRSGVDALCAAPDGAALDAARVSFVQTVQAWSAVETIRFGPVTQENRLERILFWPDRKSVGLKQVQAALAGQDATATDPATLAGKSVAMQGLGALEFVLFGTGAEALATGDAYRCAYGAAISANLVMMSSAIAAEWRDPEGFARSIANPGPDNPLYRDEAEAVTELFGVFVHGLELIRDVRIGGFLGDDAGADKPKQAVFWRSDATVASIAGNLDGLQRLFDVTDFSRSLDPDTAWIPSSIDFEFHNAGNALAKLDGAIADVLADPARRETLAYARLVTSSLSDLFGVKLADGLDLSAGFSSLDGD
ncbi:MAG: peptidase M75, Imelysin [Rhizobiaceae bacterium]|nr:peptidase M75, Imelysin [Rhizobiaceae bacterium]